MVAGIRLPLAAKAFIPPATLLVRPASSLWPIDGHAPFV
jgi:hypothetical protein